MIRLHYIEGMDKQSCPAIVCCGGRMDFHGAPLSRTWVKLGDSAKKGDSAVTLGEAVTGWRVGDRVIVTGTRTLEYRREPTTEERRISAIDGRQGNARQAAGVRTPRRRATIAARSPT